MKTTQTTANYIKWLSPEDIHKASLAWLSELNFVKDEHLFFEDLIKTYTIELLEFKDFSSDKEMVDAINRSEKQNNILIDAVIAHEKKLKVLVDDIDQPEEEKEYKEVHKKLAIEIDQFLEEYKMLKTQLFTIIKEIKKEIKYRTLLDRNL
ncbi:hypothetical protein H2O64_20395 [Kordia sp. YSTF-M3]|uniref:Uncharacterized protein n=1 Tax=Kordia aestuariivivens TaxID=2759037 RepID=A0ABR7QES8_9FLAO|nr:hypothetical protein [Kordia aestuariivivens]MBC8757044.1 hypothetical protein [Kordia aestuariivivens]